MRSAWFRGDEGSKRAKMYIGIGQRYLSCDEGLVVQGVLSWVKVLSFHEACLCSWKVA